MKRNLVSVNIPYKRRENRYKNTKEAEKGLGYTRIVAKLLNRGIIMIQCAESNISLNNAELNEEFINK